MILKTNFHKARTMTIQGVAKRIQSYSGTSFEAPKYLRFILRMLREGWRVKLYIPHSNKISKYVFVYREGKIFKIRFSNHKPIIQKELDNDCDFYAGISNLRVMTTEQIAKIILKKK